ncbi:MULTISPECIES: hypothetical protein [unclassified Mesorhizobium]|uniref:hypothetical protein n=1 Tax=unclassified Mesorhizobium TaxID=325217 RepID=UPI000FD554E4|nr:MULTISPECIES: hypothetical protein [unclassified Mesorhizobium]RVB74643.1 hypothetical protein EN885_22090 [Mesorhizobium sp. M6A.T.Cr.TU.014.01.1.1]RWP76514.1 MAG: hypothetical protein EOR10_17305 [Mesorhizobium sp.]RWQ05390.1 MAG: hypothetical protein EOR91_15810 [Mesorhizobium sp.]RWQ11459.1 MAG: hypothetical protein EOR90_00390 [Mesorhizobium sp.]
MRIWQSRVPDGARFLHFVFFKDSDTIAPARLQMIVGLVAAILSYVDPQVAAPVLPSARVPVARHVRSMASRSNPPAAVSTI